MSQHYASTVKGKACYCVGTDIRGCLACYLVEKKVCIQIKYTRGNNGEYHCAPASSVIPIYLCQLVHEQRLAFPERSRERNDTECLCTPSYILAIRHLGNNEMTVLFKTFGENNNKIVREPLW